MRDILKVKVEGWWLEDRMGQGPLGQSKSRYPFNGGNNKSERTIELTKEQLDRLVHCPLCGRATINPGHHINARGEVSPHCEVCGENTNEHGLMVGWFSGPYEVVD